IFLGIPCDFRYILVRMKSAAETGYCFNVRRLRLQEKLVLLRYDPIEISGIVFLNKKNKLLH
uniref:39S ribosomal protein L33, mitochondrial n=1 Tax=Catharus ustulatus TaxID=91951 RepID=A0A8C3TRW6_CATUS